LLLLLLGEGFLRFGSGTPAHSDSNAPVRLDTFVYTAVTHNKIFIVALDCGLFLRLLALDTQ
jgi:hypothetical protein